MKNNYYNELIEKIDFLIKEEKHEEALVLINDELSMPYVPLKTEKKLKQLLSLVKSSVVTESNKISFDKIYELLLSPKIHEMDKIEIVNLLDEVNLRNYIDEIKELLIKGSGEISLSIKARLINKLKTQGVEETVKVNKDKNVVEINLTDYTTMEENKEFAKDSMLIDKLLMKHPVLSQTAFMLLEEIYLNNLLNKDFKDYAYAVCVLSSKLHQQDEIVSEILDDLSNEDIELISVKIKNILDYTQIINT